LTQALKEDGVPDDLDQLEQDLRVAAALVDPVPSRLVEGAITAYAWRTVDADLAELVFDSLSESAVTAVRGGDQPRLVTFRTQDLTVELELSSDRLVGRVEPASLSSIDVQQGARTVAVPADALGRFATSDLVRGALRLRIRTGERTVVTDWI
jgi:hypothetical protein